METYLEFVKPELLVLIPVLYALGCALKKAGWFDDRYIPAAVGAAGILLCCVWVISTSQVGGVQEAFAAVFTAVTQGILCAGAGVYGNQLMKQHKKK